MDAGVGSLRPDSLHTMATLLRLFAGYLVDHHPDVTAIAAAPAHPDLSTGIPQRGRTARPHRDPRE
jgi:hypothetical protein